MNRQETDSEPERQPVDQRFIINYLASLFLWLTSQGFVIWYQRNASGKPVCQENIISLLSFYLSYHQWNDIPFGTGNELEDIRDKKEEFRNPARIPGLEVLPGFDLVFFLAVSKQRNQRQLPDEIKPETRTGKSLGKKQAAPDDGFHAASKLISRPLESYVSGSVSYCISLFILQQTQETDGFLCDTLDPGSLKMFSFSFLDSSAARKQEITR